MMSKTIKKTINNEEDVKKHFSVSSSYIKIKISALILKWLLLFFVISIIIYLIYRSEAISLSAKEEIPLAKIILAINLFFVFVIIPAIVTFNNFYIKISNEFVFTNKRIIAKNGWIETTVKTIYYDKITDISVKQSLLDKIIKTGTISISTAGSDGYEMVLDYIRKPYEIKNFLYKTKEEQKRCLA